VNLTVLPFPYSPFRVKVKTYEVPEFTELAPLMATEGLTIVRGVVEENGTIPNCSLMSTFNSFSKF